MSTDFLGDFIFYLKFVFFCKYISDHLLSERKKTDFSGKMGFILYCDLKDTHI